MRVSTSLSDTANSQQKPTRQPRTSLSSDHVYAELKGMAARFEFKPNERINEIELCKQLNVSRTPLREVLNRLMVEGFLTRSQHKGFIGRPLDPREIGNLYEFRRGLEVCIVRLACERATGEQLEELAAFASRSAGYGDSLDPTEHCRLDEEFHARLAEMTGNGEYVRSLENINARIHYIRLIGMRQRRPQTQSEHLAIVAALQARDPDEAARIVQSHIVKRREQIVSEVQTGLGEIYTRAL